MATKKYRRTTIEIDERLYKRTKALAVEKEKTLRDIISEALEEKIAAEEEKNDALDTDFLRDNPSSRKIVKAMEEFVSHDAAILLFSKKCEVKGCDPSLLDKEDITDDFLLSLCNGIRYLSNVDNKECLEKLKTVLGGSVGVP